MSNREKKVIEWNQVIEGQSYWGNLSPDKIGFRVSNRILNLDNARRFMGKGKVSVINKGGEYWDIYVHAEALLPGVPMITQLSIWFGMLALEGVFRADVGMFLLAAVNDGINLSNPENIILYQETLAWLGFIWCEMEVAEDFQQKSRPIKRLDSSVGNKFRSTLYSDDAVQYRRERIDANSIKRTESKSNRKSLVCEYNRAKKIGSTDPLWRVELRLQRHHLSRLSPYDLCFDFHSWVYWRKDKLEKFVRKAVKPGAWEVCQS